MQLLAPTNQRIPLFCCHRPIPCLVHNLHLLMLLMRPRDALIQNLSKQSGQAGGWRVQVCCKSFSIFDPPLPRIQAPVTRATAPVSRHATPWTNLQDWVWTWNVRCCGENFQWEKYGAGVEVGATGSWLAYHWVNCPFTCFPSWLHSKSAHLAERVKFIQGATTCSFCSEFNWACAQKTLQCWT